MCLATMINSQNFFHTATWPTHFLKHSCWLFNQQRISEKRLQMPLRLHQIVKDQRAFGRLAENHERGSVAAHFRVVNRVAQKVLFLPEASHFEQCLVFKNL